MAEFPKASEPIGGDETAKSERLASWKEIAKYLGTTPRNALRWRAFGLPVHNHPTSKNVWALTAELDSWLEQRAKPGVLENTPSRRWLLAGGGFFAGLAAGVGISSRRDSNSEAAQFETNTSAEPQLVRRIPSSGPAEFATWASEARYVFVSASKEPVIFKIDAHDWTVAARIPMRAIPTFMAVPFRAPNITYILDELGHVHTLDPTSHTTRLMHSLIRPAYAMAAAPDGRNLYFTERELGLVRMSVPTQARTVLTKGGHVYQVNTDATGDYVLVTYLFGGPGGRTGHDSIEIIHAGTGELIKRFTGLPSSGGGGGLNRQNNEWWVGLGDACLRPEYDHVGCLSSPSTPVLVINATSLLPGPLFNPPGLLSGPIQFSPCGSIAYLPGTATLMIVDTATRQLRSQLPLPHCGHIAFRDDRDLAVIPQRAGDAAILKWRMPVDTGVDRKASQLLILPSRVFDPRQVDPSTIRINGQPVPNDAAHPISVFERAPGKSEFPMRVPINRLLTRGAQKLQFHALTYAGLVLRGEART